MKIGWALFIALTTSSCGPAPNVSGPTPPQAIEENQCWSHADCQGGGATMCSLQHSGVEPPARPDECVNDRDCVEAGQRCVIVGSHKACSGPGVCEMCCRP